MKVSKRNVPVYYERNKHFIEEADGLVGDIFQHQGVGSTGYIAARTSSPYSPQVKVNDEPEAPSADDSGERLQGFDVSGLGEYERRIFSRLVLGKYRTTVLKGDMGSGKSATIDCLMEVLQRPRGNVCGMCKNCNPIIIKLNFNAGFQDTESKVLVGEFRQELYDQLRQELRKLFADTNLTNSLRQEVISNNKRRDKTYAAFDLFAQMHGNDVEWQSHTDAGKTDLLFKYVDDRTANGTKLLTDPMRLIYFAKTHLHADPGCFVLFFDNIDSVVAEAQYAILAEILAYQEIAKVQALVTLRRANFATFVHNHAATAFWAIDHIGPDIKEVVVKRLNHYADNWESIEEVQGLNNPAYRQAVRARIDYLLKTKDDGRGAIQRVASICGSSIRMGLYMSERFFLNSAVPFDEEPRYKDDMVRAVFVGNSKSNEISPEDDCIANLLLNKFTGEASLLNIRLLQLIAALEQDETNRTVRNLGEMLKAIGGWSKDEIRTAFNYLLHMRKPLLWVDGKTKYDKLTMIRHADDVLHLTEAGYFFLKVLLLDLVYVQEAALSVRWDARHIPTTVDYSKVVERFQVLRCFLEELIRQDYNQTNNFTTWLAANRARITIKPLLFINRIIAALGRSVLNILLQRINESGKHDLADEMRLEAVEELRNWRSMINIWLGTERELLRTSTQKLEQLSKEYRDRVPLK